jgi:hypothetical protein
LFGFVASAKSALGFTFPQDKSVRLILFTARNAIWRNFLALQICEVKGDLVISGQLLGFLRHYQNVMATERTTKAHRRRLMEKIKAGSLLSLC